MKKQLLFLLTIILSFNCYSQISFEKGYYINNSYQKTNCLIKNIDWKNNPTDRSSEIMDDLNNDKNPTFKEEKLFLKV